MKVHIVTIVDNNNLGNRLQNFAVQEILDNMIKEQSETIKNETPLNKKTNILEYLLRKIKFFIKCRNNIKSTKTERGEKFREFNKNINFSNEHFDFFKLKQYKNNDFYIVGSDQVWNPNIARLREFDLITFTKSENKISFSASFGISELPEECKEKTKKALMDFKAISVREEAGKKIVEELTGRRDVEVLVDPTMLLTAEEWDKVSNNPEQLKTNRYILNYFLGELSEKRKNEINRIAKENNCEVINILDKNSPFYQTGPSEFLYLEKNAFLICTDSFHSCVFSILYNRPFIVFDREDNTVSMNSRIETLLGKFQLQDRRYNNNEITKEQLNCDYTNAYKILEEERKKANNFLKRALDII